MVTLLVDSGEARMRTSTRTDLVTMLLGLWFVGGLMLDVWAHNNVPELESFFTPWHAAFYSGFAATGLWICWLVWRNIQAGRTGAAAVPRGYLGAVIALPVFAVFGAGDFLWHTIFGIEQDITILFSPTHLGLIVSMTVILTAPLRAAWSDPAESSKSDGGAFRSLLPAILSMTFGATLILLFMQYVNAFDYSAAGIIGALSPELGPAGDDNYDAGFLTSRAAFSSLLVTAPLLLLARRWRLPFGTATILTIPFAILSGAALGFRNVSTIVALVAAGIVVDLLALRIRPMPNRRWTFWGFGALVPFIVWTMILGVSMVVQGAIPSEPELWTGLPLVMSMVGLTLAITLLPENRER